jgi:hypothetical protein
MKTATVYWFDSTLSTQEGIWTQDEVDRLATVSMLSSGIIAYECEFHIVLAKDFNQDSNTYRGVSLIPRCNITKIIRHR